MRCGTGAGRKKMNSLKMQTSPDRLHILQTLQFLISWERVTRMFSSNHISSIILLHTHHQIIEGTLFSWTKANRVN